MRQIFPRHVVRSGIFAVFALLGSAFGALAQDIGECDWRSTAANLAEPWDAMSRTYANGAVRVALIDTIEPAAAAYYLLVLSPPYDEVGGRQCVLVGLNDQFGFAGMQFEKIRSGYDPAKGLSVSVPVSIYSDDGAFVASTLRVLINQTTGAITPELVPAHD